MGQELIEQTNNILAVVCRECDELVVQTFAILSGADTVEQVLSRARQAIHNHQDHGHGVGLGLGTAQLRVALDESPPV